MFKILTTLFILITVFMVLPVKADRLDDINKLKEDYDREYRALSSANQINEKTLSKLKQQLEVIKNNIIGLESQILKKEKELKEGEEALEYQKQLLYERSRSYYKNIGKAPFSLMNFIVAENLSTSIRNFFYQKQLIDDDRKTIVKIATYIKDVELKKNQLQTEKDKLAIIKKEVDEKEQFLDKEVQKTNKYLSVIQGKIAELSAERDRLIASRLAALNLPQSAYTTTGGCSSDLTNGKEPGFSPRFGFFSFGVPHRVGMSQYGAKGRAESGKNAEDIVKFYYNAEHKTGYDTGINIHVVGTNEYGQSFDQNWNIEEYLKHVYEVPAGWPMEALKAQAIAARSYALAYTNNGQRTICPSQKCQVVKQEENADTWKQAVEQTKGVVLLNGGSPISAYFSSTAGGYTYESSADINSRPWTKNSQDGRNSYSNFDDVRNNAYDKDSPWFYCDWGARSGYGGTAWLKREEVADIVNVIMLVQKDGSTIGNVYQPDKPNPAGKETWDANKVKDELRNRGGSPYNSIDSVSVSADFGSGRSTSVMVSGDAGTKSFDAWSEFKIYFNQRAPANIQIVGPLFNVEKR